MARLREKVEHMAPGADRAHYFWLASVQAEQADDRQTRDRLRLLAVAEPGVPTARMADWLRRTMADPDLRRSEQYRLLQQLSTLYERKPNDEALWHLQMAQASSASEAGQDSLARTLQLSSLRLGQRHGWRRDRQLDYWLQGRRPAPADQWEAAFKVAAGHPQLLWRLLESCGNLDQWQRAVRTFPGQPDRPRLERCFAEVFARVHGRVEALDSAQRCQKWPELVHHTQASGRVDNEIGTRQGYGGSLCNNGQIKLGLRQLEAALQLRRDHPSLDPDWAPKDRRLGAARAGTGRPGPVVRPISKGPQRSRTNLGKRLEAALQGRIPSLRSAFGSGPCRRGYASHEALLVGPGRTRQPVA